MKVIVSKSDLQDAINAVIPAVAVKPSTPVLSGIYFSAENSTLTIRATNFSLDITAKIGANIESTGRTVTAGKYFAPIVSKLSGEIVTLQSDGKNLTAKSEAASFNLLTMDASDFPKPASDQPTGSFRISGTALRKLIAQTVFACGDDQSRPIFTGVHFKIDGTDIRAEASNTHRVAFARDSTYDEASAEFIVPTATLKAIAPALKSQIVTVNFNANSAAFAFDNVYLVTRLIDGSYPNANKVIPTSVKTTATLDANELRAALERVQVIARATDYNTVACNFTADGLEISSNKQGIGRAVEHVDAEVSGADINIAFNFVYVLDALKVITGKVELGMNDNLNPARFKDPANPDFLCVITPLRAN